LVDGAARGRRRGPRAWWHRASSPSASCRCWALIALVGVVVNNAIVLLDLVERLREQGVEGRRALTIAVQQRVRPIALTAGTTVAGLLPLALGGTTLWPPMAWAMISGLVASTSLCLLLVPALYRLLFLRQSKRGRAPRKHPQTASEVPA
jgi:Cu/Ag efflux pump CusA